MSSRATYLSCVFYGMEDEFEQIITKQLTADYYINFYSVFPTNFRIVLLPHTNTL